MIAQESNLVYLSPELSEVMPDVRTLKVPVRDNSIAVDLAKPNNFTELHVERDSNELLIARTDGQPIQIELHGTRTVGTKGLIRPIASLVLSEEVEADGSLWSVLGLDEDPEIADPYTLFKFSEILARVMLQKQRDELATKLSKMLMENIKLQKESN